MEACAIVLPWLQADLEEDDVNHKKPKWYRRASVWNRAWPAILTCCLLLVAVLLRKFADDQVSHLNCELEQIARA